MTTETQANKSMISGGNAEGLKSEAAAPAPSVADAFYPDVKVEAKADATTEKAGEQTPEQKAQADKAVADKAAADKVVADKKAVDDKAAADKAVADKAAADKAEAERIAKMTPDEKAAHDKAEADKKAAEDAKAKKEPVDLTDMAMPEGFAPDAEVMGEMTKIVNELGLDKAAAEKLAPVGAKIAEGTVKQINSGYEDIRAGWRDQVANDPVLGSKEQMAIADRGLEAYGSPALRTLLDETGIGDHPEIIRAFHKIGKTVSEDEIVRGGSGDTKHSSAADEMYPTMK